MSTDANDFDTWLKARLHRDIAFRSTLWIGIAFATGYLAIFYRGVNAVEYLDRISNALAPIANIVGTASLLLCVLAMMLKDLEATLSTSKLISATRGHLGGFVRRLAGDLSLWTLGAFLTMLATLALVVLRIDISAGEYAIVGSLATLLAILAAFIAGANVFVRRAGPTPLASHVSSPLAITCIYMASLVALIGRVLYAVA